MTKLEDKILELLREPTTGLRASEIRRHLNLSSSAEIRQCRTKLRELCDSGKLVKRRGGRYWRTQASNLASGKLSVNPRGFGFVSRDDAPDQPDIFIPPKGMHMAMSGDRVQVSLTDVDDERGPSGIIVQVLETGQDEITGVYLNLFGKGYLSPMRRDFPESIPVAEVSLPEGQEIADGDWVAARVLPRSHPGERLEVCVCRRIGKADSVAGDLDAIVNEFNLLPPYSSEEKRQAGQTIPREIGREDLQALPIVTVDPEDAKDFDDALSFQWDGQSDTVTVGIHIADVAAYIAPDSPLDLKARERGFTAYLPGRTLPMLPKPLAAELCSLREDQPRRAHSVFLTVSRSSGEVIGQRRVHSLIRVCKRLSFNQVEDFLQERPIPPWPPEVHDTLAGLRDTYRVMRQTRAAREEFMELESNDVRVMCAEDPPRIVGLKRSEPNESHALVEEFMLAANSAVAKELAQRRIPGVYRIHDQPRPADIDEFRRWLKDSLSIKLGSMRDRAGMNRFLEKIAKTPFRDIAASAFLRTLQRAVYAAGPGEHFGLGKSLYCHFTSPIRRYSDLLVHQQLWAADAGEPFRTPSQCGDLAKACTELEANNDSAYFAAVDRLKLRYIGQQAEANEAVYYEGIVASRQKDRLSVFIPELGLYGSIPTRSTRRPPRMPARRREQHKAMHPPLNYRCGEIIFVEVEKADTVKGLLELRPMRVRLK